MIVYFQNKICLQNIKYLFSGPQFFSLVPIVCIFICYICLGCVVKVEADYGRISSPGYLTRNEYPNDLDCTIQLYYKEQQQRTLLVEEFETEENFDVLQVCIETSTASKEIVNSLLIH